jgi:hypothetical protein
MFGKKHRFTRIAGVVAAAVVFVPVAHANGEHGAPRAMPSDYAAVTDANSHWIPRAMPSDYATQLGQLPRAMPADYGTVIEPGQYGMPRAIPSDFEPVGGTSSGNGFDWADAGIGAGATFGLVLLALAAAISVRSGRRLEQA